MSSTQQTTKNDSKSDSVVANKPQGLQTAGAALEPRMPGEIVPQALENPESLSNDDVNQLQRSVGNQTVSQLFTSQKNSHSTTPIQTRLALGPVNDKYEQEADQVASKVVNHLASGQSQDTTTTTTETSSATASSTTATISSNSSSSSSSSDSSSKSVQRKEREEEEGLAQMKPVARVSNRLRGGGQRKPIDQERTHIGWTHDRPHRPGDTGSDWVGRTNPQPNIVQRAVRGIQRMAARLGLAQRSHESQREPEPGHAPARQNGYSLPSVQRSSSDGGSSGISASTESAIQGAKGGGRPMDEGIKGKMEQAMGADFSGVRIHTDARSDTINRSIQARAFTTGNDVFFRSGEYNPGSRAGQELLAHELTHTVQQGAAGTLRQKPVVQRKDVIEPVTVPKPPGVDADGGDKDEPKDGQKNEADAKAEDTKQGDKSGGGDGTPTDGGGDSTPNGNGTGAPADNNQPQADTTTTNANANQPQADATNANANANANANQPQADTTNTTGNGNQPQTDTANTTGNGSQPQADGTTTPNNTPNGQPDAQSGNGPNIDAQMNNADVTEDDLAASNKPDHQTALETKSSSPNGVNSPDIQAQSQPSVTEELDKNTATIEHATDKTDELDKKTDEKPKEDKATAELDGAENQGGEKTEDTGGDKVNTGADGDAKDTTAGGGLDGVTAQVAELSSGSAEFLPVNKDEVDEDTAAQLEKDRTKANELANSFLAYAGARVGGIVAKGAQVPVQVKAAATTATTAVSTAVATQHAATKAHYQAEREKASKDAQRTQGFIATQHTDAVASIRKAVTSVRTQVVTQFNQALIDLAKLEQDQITEIGGLYTQAASDYRKVGQDVGAEAISIGNQRYEVYRPKGPRKSDGWLTGPVTYDKAAARAKAAKEVAAQFKKGLIAEGENQAKKVQEGKPKDIQAVRDMVKQSRKSLVESFTAALKSLTNIEKKAIESADEARKGMEKAVAKRLAATLKTLNDQEKAYLKLLTEYGQRQVDAINRDAQKSIDALQQGVGTAVSDITSAIQNVRAEMQSTDTPDVEALQKSLAIGYETIATAESTLAGKISEGVSTSQTSLTEASGKAVEGLGTLTQQGRDDATQVVNGMSNVMSKLRKSAKSGFAKIKVAGAKQATQAGKNALEGFNKIKDGIKNAFAQTSKNLKSNFEQGKKSLTDGLKGALGAQKGQLLYVIKEEADKAAAKIKPRWMKVLKVVVLIVVAVVIAVTLGPLVIGFVGGVAAGLGASAAVATAVGAIVGGAIVGAATGVINQVISNAFDGEDLFKGVGQAALAGAIGGALGGVGGLASNAIFAGAKGVGSAVLKFGFDTAFDALGGMVADFAAGKPITLEGVLMGAAIGVAGKGLSAGLGKIKFVQNVNAKSYGLGYKGGNKAGGFIKGKIGSSSAQVDVPAGTTPPKTDADTGTGTAPKTDADTGTGTTPKTDADAGTGTTPKTDADAGTGTTPKTDADAGTGTTPKTEADANTGSGNGLLNKGKNLVKKGWENYKSTNPDPSKPGDVNVNTGGPAGPITDAIFDPKKQTYISGKPPSDDVTDKKKVGENANKTIGKAASDAMKDNKPDSSGASANTPATGNKSSQPNGTGSTTKSTTQPATTTQKPSDNTAATEKKGPKNNQEALLADVKAAAASKDKRRTAVLELAQWARSNIPNRKVLDAYLASGASKEEITATVGQLATLIARMEFLLGWMYEGGVGKGGKDGWENKGTNKGAFPSHYKSAIKTFGETSPWCTTFAGYAFQQAGFKFNEDTKESKAKSIFWSGYRLRHWAKYGKTVDNKTTLTDKGSRVADAGSSGNLIDKDAWASLKKQLTGVKDEKKKKEILTAFFKDRPAPQAGDIVIIGANNDFRKSASSHTMMVDQYDATTFTISTVEGNAQNAVIARKIRLTDLEDVGKMVFIARLGAENFVKKTDSKANDKPGQATDDKKAGGSNQTIKPDQVLSTVRAFNEKLVALSHGQGWIKSDDPNATVYAWMHGAKSDQKAEKQKISDR